MQFPARKKKYDKSCQVVFFPFWAFSFVADYLGYEKNQQPSLFVEFGPFPLPVRARDAPHHGEALLLLVPQLIVALDGHRVEVHAVRGVGEEPGFPPDPFDLFLVLGEAFEPPRCERCSSIAFLVPLNPGYK